jgi:hypothetical protein
MNTGTPELRRHATDRFGHLVHAVQAAAAEGKFTREESTGDRIGTSRTEVMRLD